MHNRVVKELATERERLLRQAYKQNAKYPQYEGYWEGWALGEILSTVTTKMGTAFEPGDRVLVDPEPHSLPGDVEPSWFAYSWRNGINTVFPKNMIQIILDAEEAREALEPADVLVPIVFEIV